MATIDLTLDSFKVPAIENYTPPFGTKIVKTDANKGGLSTVEVNSNIMMPFANMRPKVLTENSSTTEIEYDAKLCFSSSLLAGATLELDYGAYEGCRVQVTNLSSYTCTVEYNSATLVSIPTGANVEVLWTGSSWMLSTTGTVATGNVMAPTSSAVHAAIEGAVNVIDDKFTWKTLLEFQAGGTFTLPDSATWVLLCVYNNDSNKLGGSICFPIKASVNEVLIPANDTSRSIWTVSNSGRTFTAASSSPYKTVSVYYR